MPLSLFPGAFSLNLAPLTIVSGAASPATTWARIGFEAAGRLLTAIGVGNYPTGEITMARFPQWFGANNFYTFIGNDFEIMCSVVSGNAPDVAISDAIDTWLTLGPSGRLWVHEETFPPLGGIRIAVYKIQIRRRPGGSIILAEADYTLNVQAVPP